MTRRAGIFFIFFFLSALFFIPSSYAQNCTYLKDEDGDGYGSPLINSLRAPCNQPPAGYVLRREHNDCDDHVPEVNPGVFENACFIDLKTGNVNMHVPVACSLRFPSTTLPPLSPVGVNGSLTIGGIPAQTLPHSSVNANGIDLNVPIDGEVLPGLANESASYSLNDLSSLVKMNIAICSNGYDDDCDGDPDLADSGCFDIPQRDDDGDGYCDASNPCKGLTPPAYCGDAAQELANTPCLEPGILPGDCNDRLSDPKAPLMNPSVAEEVKDGVDNDCDKATPDSPAGKPDQDNDHDGYCESAVACTDGSVIGDCDDINPAIKPTAAEVCNNGVDDDCNPQTLDFCVPEDPKDDDGDGYCNSKADICEGGAKPNDCDDADSSISPVALEACDGKDNNCNGLIDDNCGLTPDLGNGQPADKQIDTSFHCSLNTQGNVPKYWQGMALLTLAFLGLVRAAKRLRKLS